MLRTADCADGARQRSAGQFSRWGPPTGIAAHRAARLRTADRADGARQRSAGQFSRWGPPTGIAAHRAAKRAYRQTPCGVGPNSLW